MRIVSLVLVGCGRLGFEPVSTSSIDGPPLGSGDTFADTCGFDRITTISHGGASDESVGTLVADAIATSCGTTPVRRALSQDGSGVLAANGRPLTPPDELVVIGGGDGPNRAIAYLLERDTALVWSGTANATIRLRATDRLIASGPVDSAHDYAMVFVVREPIGGGLVVSAQGFVTEGTLAAGHWVRNVLAPQLATVADGWVVVEWTDSDGAPGPTDGDTFSEIERGR